MFSYPDALIMVFCKAPVAGQVKTRLIPPLSAEEAARLHCELTEKTLQTATHKRLCEVQLWCSPAIGHPFFAKMATRYAVQLRLQRGADLGMRMRHAFSQALRRYNSAILIGCDCPSLTGADLEEALACLRRETACVLAPAEDGGYTLIGLKRPHAFLFENMPWGGDKVMALTQARLQGHKLPYLALKTQWDIDTVADLERYRRGKAGKAI